MGWTKAQKAAYETPGVKSNRQKDQKTFFADTLNDLRKANAPFTDRLQGSSWQELWREAVFQADGDTKTARQWFVGLATTAAEREAKQDPAGSGFLPGALRQLAEEPDLGLDKSQRKRLTDLATKLQKSLPAGTSPASSFTPSNWTTSATGPDDRAPDPIKSAFESALASIRDARDARASANTPWEVFKRGKDGVRAGLERLCAKQAGGAFGVDRAMTLLALEAARAQLDAASRRSPRPPFEQFWEKLDKELGALGQGFDRALIDRAIPQVYDAGAYFYGTDTSYEAHDGIVRLVDEVRAELGLGRRPADLLVPTSSATGWNPGDDSGFAF